MPFLTLAALPLAAAAASAALSPRQSSPACAEPAARNGGREGLIHGRGQVPRGAPVQAWLEHDAVRRLRLGAQ